MKTLNQNKLRAFTLIELMVTFVIGASLIAIATPAYLNYVKKARLSEGYLMLQKAVQGIYATHHKPLMIKIDGDTYFGEKRYPLGLTPLTSVGYVQNGITHRSYAPKPSKNNEIRIKINDPVCYQQDVQSKRCGAIQEFTPKIFDSMGFDLQVVGGNYKFLTKSYFIPSIRTHQELVNILTAEGYAAVYRKNNSFGSAIFQTSIVSVLADLDGDLDMTDDNDRVCANNVARFSLHSPRATYISRILYIDQNTGELQSSEGIIQENLGE
ncbi:MAG TPA: prepilin-type N-terminal cleavage/methylation domain-containing protein [Oligoflexia bacterium]|nr:prepilin-type N-terminal cleavage/methylation domain-containing protein [Oligoflexia bacterium]HMR24704.1 prepilin-type N-terminal cleavage/methylation domain-containing protein [Oligoflexia bacterium]